MLSVFPLKDNTKDVKVRNLQKCINASCRVRKNLKPSTARAVIGAGKGGTSSVFVLNVKRG